MVPFLPLYTANVKLPCLEPIPMAMTPYLSVSSRQNQKPFAVNFSSQIVYAESSSSSNTREPMLPPYNVLMTGSTKAAWVESAVKSLREEFGEQHVWGTKCDVRQGQDVKDLFGFAQRNLKYIDPGMVTTDILMSGATTKQAKFFINVLAEPAEVAKFFINVLAEPAEVTLLVLEETDMFFKIEDV